MSAWMEAKKEVLKALKTALGKQYAPSVDELETPPEPRFGDFAFPCFALAKGWKKSPVEIAVELVGHIEIKGLIRKVEPRGPYINFFLDTARFGKIVVEQIEQEKTAYGHSVSGADKSVLVEYAQPNTHKEIHVGHLRNFFVGYTTTKLLETVGYRVIPVTYTNDLGMHVAKCLWAMKKFHVKEADPSKEERSAFLGKVYTEATQASETYPNAKEEISAVFQALESGKRGPFLSLWKKTRKWSIEEIKGVFKELGLIFQAWYYESDFIESSHLLIEDLKHRQVARLSEGATIVDLSEEKLGVNLLVRSDGTLLYNAKDLPLAMRKEEEFHPQRSLYVVDVRQSLAMQQLFATLKRMGFQKELTHLSYDFVTLKEGAMSSRKGNIVRYQDFRDSMVEWAHTETQKRHTDWKQTKMEKVARAVAFSAMRFGMLRQDLSKPIVFDMEEALSFDGFSGPYLLYTYARIQSILRKVERRSLEKRNMSSWKTEQEHQLFVTLASYPHVVFQTAQDFHLDRLAQYLFELCKQFSVFYHEVPVLQAETAEQMADRATLVAVTGQTIKNGLSILGIQTIEEM
ncbi:MAG: Arginine-tRNA ligase [Candidatus Uhrbacteria bacterium GW2011_GWA2_41_10]|nr:MAG: Arginine-tRNA ligase [Candidatus Uhrbacteria bacterium GW2011_GWA2_41_10]